MKKKIVLGSLIVLFADQLSKILIDIFLVLGKSITIFEKFIYITKLYNDGISFSILEGQRWLIIAVSLFILVFIYLYMKKFTFNKRNTIAFCLLYGGIFGNLIDRIVHGYVIDFIDVYVFNYNYPVFNIADSAICIGVCLLLYAIFRGEDNETSSK